MSTEVNKEEDVKKAFELCAQDNLEEFQLLVPSKVTVNRRYKNKTLLIASIENKSIQCLHYLLANNVNVNAKDKLGRVPLMIAIAKKNYQAVCALINIGADLTADDDNGWTPLHYAAQSSEPEIIKMILDFGGNPNVADFEGATPLHIAGDQENSDCVSILVKAGADPSIRNNFGVKASDVCINRGHGAALDPNYPENVELKP